MGTHLPDEMTFHSTVLLDHATSSGVSRTYILRAARGGGATATAAAESESQAQRAKSDAHGSTRHEDRYDMQRRTLVIQVDSHAARTVALHCIALECRELLAVVVVLDPRRWLSVGGEGGYQRAGISSCTVMHTDGDTRRDDDRRTRDGGGSTCHDAAGRLPHL